MLRLLSVSLLEIMFLTATNAQAESIKPLMREMKATTREAATMARDSFDLSKAKQIFETYIYQSERALQISTPANKARFQTFIADARSASATVTTGVQFNSSLVKLAGQCRSCHDAN
jgi:cytochrome c556